MTERIEDARGRIPERYRPPADATEFADLEAAIEAAVEETASWQSELNQARAELEANSTAQARLRTDRVALDTPWRQAHDELTELQRTLEDGVRLLGEPPKKAPKMGTPADDAKAARLLGDRTTEMKRGLERNLEAVAAELGEIADQIVSLLEEHDAGSRKELDDHYVEARSQDHQLAAQVAQFKSQIGEARDLDDRIVPLDALALALQALGAHLTDGKFVAFAVERRQRALLVAASEILARMTGDRYGFAADFDIIDKLTGQPRSTKTLSGGETFLASLALALGLVEMAARSGGRLEALFLDEGFGALDADALDDALSELERRAESGRLVGVISHIGAVAERIETVLRVDRSPEGSQVRLVDQSGRLELVERDLSEGLLA
jgi:exonuclease SbcC